MKKLILILGVLAVVAFGSCKKTDVKPDVPQSSQDCQCFQVVVVIHTFPAGVVEYRYPLGVDSIFQFCQTNDSTIQMKQFALTTRIKGELPTGGPIDVNYTQVNCY